MIRVPRRAALSALAMATAVVTLSASMAVGTAHASTPLVAVPSLAPLSPSMATAVATLPARTPFGAFVHFDGGDAAARAALLTDHGLKPARDFASVDVTFATGTLSALLGLRGEPAVTYLEADRKLKYFGDTGTWATRARVARTAVANGPYRDTTGRVLDGTGVGVAVVDSGVDGLHPDLARRIGKAYKVVCTTPGVTSTITGLCYGPSQIVDMTAAPFTDNTGGHGTHVSGIMVGDGTASHGTYQGVAPGATLYSYGVGEGISVFTNAEAFNHMITNYDTFTPRIKVVNNSYGDPAGTAYDPNEVFSKLTRQLVAKGVTLVFSAGNGDANNDGGTGSDDRLSSTAKDPTPGVITAANYDDLGTGTRAGVLASSSSRGHKGTPVNYPDLAAPGEGITSTCNAALPVCRLELFPTLAWAPRYATIGGTSMASPHIAGAAALLYQARPDLTPTQVEDVLQDTALRFGDAASYEADPQNTGGLTSFDKGAGLLDVPAALDALGVVADGRVSTRTPTLAITAPGEGAVNDGTAPLQVAGDAFDGAPAPFSPLPVTVALGDAGDLSASGSGSADFASLVVQEELQRTDPLGNTLPGGLRVTVGLRDVTEVSPFLGSELHLQQNVGGKAFGSIVILDASGVSTTAKNADSNNAVPTQLVVNPVTDTVSFFLALASLGNPPAGSLGTNVRAFSFFEGAIADQIPGGGGESVDTAPEYGHPYHLVVPGSAGSATAEVRLSVDSGTEQAASLTGASPDYGFGATVPTTGLADGAHTVVARLYLNGVLSASDTTAFTVSRPRIVTSSATFTSPADGTTVARAVVDVTGTATTDADAAVNRTVTLQVTGAGFDSGEITALGTSTWSVPVDFGALAAGSYLLTARFLLDGVVAATTTRLVAVPVPVVLVSCAPQALRFWQDQYSGGGKATLTATERDALASKAAELSSGWFGNASAVVTALYVKGKVPAQQAAAQQYAVLLLDLAGGQLSATFSRQVGLSGAERLDPATYDTSRLGDTVSSAAAWVRTQLPSGDHVGAEQVAGSLARGTGLTC